jgi:hypothetical protein
MDLPELLDFVDSVTSTLKRCAGLLIACFSLLQAPLLLKLLVMLQ